MRDEEDFERQATTAVLATGAMVGRASFLLVALALIVCVVPNPGIRLPLAASFAFGVIQGWFALRVAVDARLFGLAGMPDHLAALDRVLGRLRTSAPRERGFPERSRGALRLWKLQVLAAVLQALCLLWAVFEVAWS
jgi:hypothetical protein